jgi:hypothetical protein
MKVTRAALAAALVACSAASAAAQSVSLRFQDGTVTLSAQNAPLRTILAEWARVGGSRIVNAEQVAGGPFTIELTGVSERQALSVLLRNVSGYIVAPRSPRAAGASSFDRILILPTSRPVSPAPSRAAAPPPPVIFVPGDPDEDPAGDIPPDGFPRTVPSGADRDILQQLREAAERADAGRETVDEQTGAGVDDQPARGRPGRSSRTPADPFGNVQGSSRPGEITPAPRDSDDDDPDR